MKKNLNKKQIFDAASTIANGGNIPTLSKIREHLGAGSKVTIHKYFREWKQECFRNFSSLNKVTVIDNSRLLEEHRFLKLEIQKQLERNEHYARELIYAEKANIELKEEKRQLNATNQELQLKLSAAEKTNNALECVTQKIQIELDLNTNATIQKMQQTIDELRLELKTVNATSISALRETSNKGHETLMHEKVNNINLQAKTDNLHKELLESKKQVHETIMTAQVQIRSLSRQNEQLQKIIQDHGLEKSPQLEEVGSLQFSKGAASCGK